MSTIERKPLLHGRDHCPGGADPIPCMISGPSGDFEGVLLATGPYAYWRLGETGEPWADTSDVAPAADLTLEDSGTTVTPDVTGALASGDDGAVEFNYDGVASSGGRYLQNDGLGGKPFGDTAFPDGVMSVCAWVKVKASAVTRRGGIVGNVGVGVGGGDHYTGWGLEVSYPGRAVRFTRGQPGGFGDPERYAETPSGLTADEWTFIVGTYDGENIRLYANAELVDTFADSSGVSPGTDDHVWIGYGYEDDGFTYSWLYGTVDEAAVWTRALSQAEIDAIYTAGVEGAGSGEMVLLSDGAGGTYWGKAPPRALEPGDEGEVLTTLGGEVVWGTVAGGDPASDTLVWMPLADSDGTLVLDAGDNVIPTLIPL